MVMKFINEDTGAVKNAVFCFTGKSPKTRPEMTTIAINAGAQVTSSVTKQTTILVIADANSMSIKAQSARDMDIDLISPTQFFGMCRNAPASEGYDQTCVEKPKTIDHKKKLTNTKLVEQKRHSLVRRIQL